LLVPPHLDVPKWNIKIKVAEGWQVKSETFTPVVTAPSTP
jgi:hypothetical protein